MQWQVAIDPNAQHLKNVQLVDTVDTSNQTIATDTIRVTAADSGQTIPTSDYTVNVNGGKITVTFNQDVTQSLNLLYATNITDKDYIASGAAAIMNNSFTMTGSLVTANGDVPFDNTTGSYAGSAQVRVGGSATGGGIEGRTTVTGHKVWADNDNQDGLRPATIQVGVFANGGTTPVQTQTVTTPASDFTFTNLPEVDANGTRIHYTVKELNVPTGYTSTVDNSTNTITNTHTPATTTITGTKTWADHNNQDGIRPNAVTVGLFANGIQVATQTVTAAQQWRYQFTNQPQKANGQDIKYTVKELNVPGGYTDKVDGFNITNTHTPATTKVTGTKTWNDGNNQDGLRPSQVTVGLYANGSQVATQTVTAADHWQYSFDKLPVNKDGQAIKYTVREVNVPQGYTAQVNGFNITNTHTPATTKVTGTKTWDDGNNQDGLRPQQVTVGLYANGQQVATQTITAADHWQYSFTKLPEYDQGQKKSTTLFKKLTFRRAIRIRSVGLISLIPTPR
ncbi:Cna B-type domain-containing protein [Lacticaseibacillus thailandensis]|uniref:Cna B-type domain-containing protein n=1 Tax=Lacticaseibacillus thailandensis TaxID=381741 RepID=UPI0006D19B07|nr:Cna B-type domain-containing protein [Lacticaseibacillus thailandensis]